MIDLATIVDPLSVERFLIEHWPAQPYWSNHGDRRLEALLEIPELQSAENAFAGAPRVRFFKPDGGIGEVTGEKANVVYRVGLTCTLGCAHIPPLMDAAEQIAADLGMPSGSVTCEIFCSDGQSGVTMHSDHDVNFAILIRGNKRWRVAENKHIRNQTNVCRPPSDPASDPSQLELADELPFPEQMPHDSHDVDVQAGGLLFLPRGWWHETQSSGECFQVNFVMNRPLWMGVLTDALANRLMRDPEWREYAYDLFGPGERREAAVNTFAKLLAELGTEFDTDDYRSLAVELIEEARLRPPDL
jgi:hypothetical protein